LTSTRVDVLLVIGAAVMAWAFPRVGSNWFCKIEQWCSKLARRRLLAVLVVGLLALMARAAELPIQPIPEPKIYDEFSYLLAGDTFAHGRLTNPTHPMWMHFETFMILQKPTYMSKYYPAQGLVLAAGQVVAGHPFWGVWLSVGLMCAALCWMMQGWMPPRWALLGGLLAVLRLATFNFWGSAPRGAFSDWGNSYWGGAVAAIGGALVLGALPRLKRTLGVRYALLLGLGLTILANSRPYESLFLSAGVAIALMVRLWGKNRPPWGLLVKRVLVPLLVVLSLTGFTMGYYFWRITGSPFQIPYIVYEKTYNPISNFPWKSIDATPEFHHQAMKDYCYEWWLGRYLFARKHPAKSAWEKAGVFVRFFLGPLFIIPVLALLLVGRWKFFNSLTKPSKARHLLLLCASPLVGIMLPVVLFPHYAAPLTGAVYALVMLAMRQLRLWEWRSRPVGLQMVRAVPVLAVAMFGIHTSILAVQRSLSAPRENIGRTAIVARLNRYPGGQLVVVQYGPNHDPFREWVYNDADIDGAKVIWARDMGGVANEELIRYFKDRRIWQLKADESPPKLFSYTSAEAGQVRLDNDSHAAK
jgi:hypothetical protein